MKTLRMFGMAMFAIVMGVSLASCTKDDNPDGGDFSNEKKLVKMVMNDEQGKALEVFTFRYDSNGRLAESSVSIDYGASTVSANYIWGDDAIQINNLRFDNVCTLSLSNGLVQSSSDGDSYTYNQSNKITKWGKATVLWDGDMAMSIYDGSDNYTFTYGESCKKGYYPMLPYFMGYMSPTEMMLFMAHPEIAGMKTKQLPTKMGGLTFAYEFDKDGYISEFGFNNNKTTLTWE